MAKPSVRPDRRRALHASTAWLIGPLLPMSSALARVLVDSSAPAIAALAEQLVRPYATPRERAVAIHDHVRDEVAFGFAPSFYAMPAEDVLAARVGFAATKTMLFVALLRAAGIEARMRFVDVDAGLLRGLLDLRTPRLDHCHAEVLLGGAWVPTDSYVVDPRLARPAQAALHTERRPLGYGMRADGRIEWDGRSASFAQLLPDDARATRRDWGVFPDVAAFYDATPEAWNRRDARLRVLFPLAALIANRQAEALRRHGPSAATQTRISTRDGGPLRRGQTEQ